MKTKLKFLFLLFAAILFSCENEDDSPIINVPNTGYNQGASVNRDFSGLILDLNGNPISGATVMIGSSSTQTSSNGLFVINDASVREKFAYIKVSKPGYIDGLRTLVPTTGYNKVNIMLIPNTPIATIASGSESTVALPNGTQVKFDGSFKDENGNAYSGSVQVGMYHLKSSDPYLNEIMPGSLLASNSSNQAKILETLGMLHVELTGSGGQKLNIANGHTAQISMEIDVTQSATAPSSIPLWSFNETTGMWKEEGSASKVGNKYVGNVSHFSWWNCDTPLDFCTLNAHVENNTGLPLINIRIDLIRNVSAFAPQRTAWTNEIGNATGLIPANEILTMKVYNNCGSLISTSNIGPFASGSNNNLPAVVIGSGLSVTTITGTLQDCSGNNVTDGNVVIKNTSSTNYFWQYYTQPVTNGSFSFTVDLCGSSQQFELFGEDYVGLQTSDEILFTATPPTTNVGIIQTCTNTNEYVSFKIDNNPTKTIISGIDAGTLQGFYINASSSSGNSSMYIWSSTIPTVGTIYSSSTFSAEFYDGITGGYFGPTTTLPTNVQFVVSQLASVGGYIDITMNGTYNDQANVQHTITCTVHVLRDN
jgi:hypothetical protein